VIQGAIFLAPHLLLLFIMPEHWPMLLFVFVFALVKGWARIRSGSILGPWLLHAAPNLAVTLRVIAATSS
jgi:membrane protease YdiL (CAAX protease family)